jgi:peroxiredoxin Q/BCP
MSLLVGDNAPKFKLQDQDGKTHELSELKGKTTLIYFYPKDETPGCTKQACDIRDNFEELQRMGMDVIGVSKDDAASHTKFKTKHELPFDILADNEHEMTESYGAWQERSMYGRKFFGTQRSAVIVGPDLKIAAVWPKIQPLNTVPEAKKWLEENK